MGLINKVIIGLFLLVSCTPHPDTPGCHDYEGHTPTSEEILISSIIKQYAPEASVHVLYEQPLGYGIMGLANKIGDHTYIIQIHGNNPDPLHTIYHEMGHVIDSEMGRLDFRGDMYWEGHKCDFEIPWYLRPWEQSANQWRDCLKYEHENGLLTSHPYNAMFY
jgi:hypothetical protein